MSNLIDVIGLDNMLKYIRGTGKTKFSIYRAGQNGNAVPVYECFDHNTIENTIQSFKNWADVVNNSAIYKILMCDLVDIDASGEVKKSRNKSGKMECLFCLNNPGPLTSLSGANSTPAQTPIDREALRKEIVDELAAKQREDVLGKKIEELSLKITAMEADDDEDDESDSLMGLINSPEKMQQINSLLMVIRGGVPLPSPAAGPINGPQESAPAAHPRSKEERTKNLNDAIRRLNKINPDIDTDLLLLADIAEKKRATFDYLLSMLRGGNL